MEPTPEQMARWADHALRAFAALTGADDGDVLSDLLADLMHWADSTGQDFEYELGRAQRHYDAELRGEV